MKNASLQSRSFYVCGLFSLLMLAVILAQTASAAEPEGTFREAESKPAGQGKISGRVLVDKDGVIAPDAKVLLLFPPPKGKNVYIGSLPLQETVADADGRFTFEFLPAGKYRVWANLGKLTSRQKQRRGVDVEITDTESTPKSIDLRLIDGVMVVVTVKDQSTGELIPDATVRPVLSDFKDDFRASGKAPVIVGPLTREQWRLEVWGKGFAKQSRSLNIQNGDDQDLEVQLFPGADLKGVVRDPEGNPVEGVGLSVRVDREREQFAYTQTDQQGRYKLDHLPFGSDLSISVSKVDWISQSLKLRLTETEQTEELTMTPRPHGGTIEGTVVDRDGNPIGDAELTNMGRSSNEVRKTKSDAEGRYKLDNLYQGSIGCEVVVRASKFAPQRLTVEPGPKDAPAEVDVEMEPGHRISGKVVDEAGNGIEGVTIYFAHGDRIFGTIGGKGTTDKEGHFNFDSLPADCPFSFQKKDFSAINDRNLKLDTDQEVLVEMSPVGVILGKVIDQITGEPIKKFSVRVTFSPLRQPNDPNGSLPSDWIKPGRSFQSESGAFELNDMIAGMPLQVMIDADGYETAIEKRVEAVRRDRAEETHFGLVRIDPKSFRKYAGHFVDAREKPVSGVQVRLIVAKNRLEVRNRSFPYNWEMIQSGQISDTADIVRFLSAVSDKEGRFEFRDVPNNFDAELVWWGAKVAQGRLDDVESWDEDGSNAIILPDPARIKGKISLKSYDKIGDIQVSSREDRIGHLSIELKAGQEEFEVNNLPAGTYDISLMTPLERIPGANDGSMTRRRLDSQSVLVEAGDVVEIEFGPN